MSRSILYTIICTVVALPHVVGTATLVPRLSSASCTGHLKDISVTSITCDYSNDCTYGSEVFVTGQVTADSDLPRPMVLGVYKTLPNVYSVGNRVSLSQVDDICESGTLTALPDDDSAEDVCPGAGVYNFNFIYENFGTRKSWFAGWSGYSFGMALHLKHEGGGKDYGTCHITVHASRGDDDSYAMNATFVSIATLGLAGVCIGLFKRRRNERLASTTAENGSEGRTKELSTNFELVQDSTSSFV
mmetsp:Transcript_26881/g.63149  ORF Transcript_26881/g.63149 Transcript_26881/m.63149 type:complete len:245 (-) Transcript_26881:160-894(-)|eukprot:CAMPEP_0197182888 /NCGR_PEP_ID=MMETSP1423-20130617/7003_1 /TAXON_ID=476441 /ORGANISM="Pseudo-nitzschia heimii, Strain UNC1101" /LENGTH=244 /DNA_ID=CAMNT_0042633391 /DNA_START=74 /DNA_END=808 /DNA_ORIENTATION=-